MHPRYELERLQWLHDNQQTEWCCLEEWYHASKEHMHDLLVRHQNALKFWCRWCAGAVNLFTQPPLVVVNVPCCGDRLFVRQLRTQVEVLGLVDVPEFPFQAFGAMTRSIKTGATIGILLFLEDSVEDTERRLLLEALQELGNPLAFSAVV